MNDLFTLYQDKALQKLVASVLADVYRVAWWLVGDSQQCC